MPVYTRVTAQYKPQATPTIHVDRRYGKVLAVLLVMGGTVWLLWQLMSMPALQPATAEQPAEDAPAAVEPPVIAQAITPTVVAQPTAQDAPAQKPVAPATTTVAQAATTDELLYQQAQLHGPYAFTVFGDSLTIGLGSNPLVVPLPHEWEAWDRAARHDWILSVYVRHFGEAQ